MLLVKPELGCSTKEIYAISDTMDLKTCDIDAVIKALDEGDDELLAKNILRIEWCVALFNDDSFKGKNGQ